MRILYFVNDLAYFRAHRLALATMAMDEGHEVALIAGGADSGDGLPPGIALHRITLDRHRPALSDLGAAWALSRIARQWQPDVIHAITMKPVLLACLVLPFIRPPSGRNRRVVLTFAGLGRVFEPAGAVGNLRRRLVAAAIRSGAARISAVATFENRSDLARLVADGVFPPDRAVSIMGAGIDPRLFYAPPARERHAPLVFLFASRLLASKGVGDFLAAARILAGRGSTARFLIAGPGDPGFPDNVDVAGALAESPTDRIRFLGAVSPDAMPDLLRRADVVCLPSRLSEGFPRSLIEAAACGCALIGTDQPAIRQIVIEGETGWLVPAGDPAALVDAMAVADADPARTRAMGGHAARHAAGLSVDIASVYRAFAAMYRGAKPSGGQM